MAKTRSPNYPALSLGDALDQARKIYAKDHRASIPREVAAKHMGYGSLNGTSLGAVSALLKYGLIEGRGEVKITDDAVAAMAAREGSPERQAALERLALSPTIFAQLYEDCGGEVGSDEAMVANLQTKYKFKPNAARAVAENFRETIEFAFGASGDNTGDVETNSEVDQMEPTMDPTPQTPATEVWRQKQLARMALEEREYMVVTLAGGRTFRVIGKGPEPTQKVWAKLIKHLELSQDEFPEDDPEESDG